MAEPAAAAAVELRPRWRSLCAELGVGDAEEVKWWGVLEARHGEPQRAYHTLSHLAAMFRHFQEHAGNLKDKVAVSLAVFFHDAVYEPRWGSPRNEMESAELFDQFAQQAVPAGDPPGLARGELVGKVRKWIVQTAHHRCKDDDEEDCKLFMDFDMAVLGLPWPAYKEYTENIRKEYAHVSQAIYCKARGAFLEATVAGPPIFATDVFRQAREAKARENAGQEATELAERFGQCTLCERMSANVALGVKARKTLVGRVTCGGACAVAVGVAAALPKLALSAVAAVLTAATLAAGRLLFGSPYVKFPYPEPASQVGTVVLAGSYNPPHLGHLAMLRYLSKAHKSVHAIIGVNPNKKYPVGPHVRQEILRAMLRELGLDNVEVVVYGGIIFKYAKSIGASRMYRGIRTWSQDGKGEKMLEFQNLTYQSFSGLWPIPTAYLQADPGLAELSSTLLRKRLTAGEGISDIVPAGCTDAVARAYAFLKGT